MTGDLEGTFDVLDAVNGAHLYERSVGGPLCGGIPTCAVDVRHSVAVTSGTAPLLRGWTGGPAKSTVLPLPED